MGKPFRFGTFFAARGMILRLTADTCLPRDVTSFFSPLEGLPSASRRMANNQEGEKSVGLLSLSFPIHIFFKFTPVLHPGSSSE